MTQTPPTAPDAAGVAKGLSDKARSFLLSVGIASWWRTEEGERVPLSLVRDGMIERAKIGGIDFSQYRLTPLGLAVRTILQEESA